MPLLPIRTTKKEPRTPASPEAPLPRRPPTAADDLSRTLANSADVVQRCDLGGCRRETFAKLRRLQDLRVGAEFQEFAESFLQTLETDDEHALLAAEITRQEAQGQLAG